MDALIPSHLVGHVVPLEIEEGSRLFGLRSSAGGEQFEITHCGSWLSEHALIASHDVPLLVLARALDTGEEIVLFDGGRHGYDALFVEAHDPDILAARRADQRLELEGSSVFAVEVGVFDNIDWDDEEDDFRDDEGVVRLVTGDAISSERLRADGFDSLGVTVIDAQGNRHDVVAEELA